MSPNVVPQVIEQAMHVAKDFEVSDRMKFVRNTIQRFTAGERVTGGPKVAEILGAPVKSKICTFLDAADFAILDELNQRWFICDVGAESVVGEEIEETNKEKTRKWSRFSFRSFNDFRERLIKLPDICVGSRANGNPIMQAAADYWLEHEEGRQYDRLVYAPPGSDVVCDTTKAPPDLNGWKGFAVAPAPGDWSRRQRSPTVAAIVRTDWTTEWTTELSNREDQLLKKQPKSGRKNGF